MDEKIKSRVIILLGVLVLIFFISTVRSCSYSKVQRNNLNEEKSKRWDLEQNVLSLKKEMNSKQEQLDSAVNALEAEKNAHEATSKALEEEKASKENLKKEMEKLTKLKEALEEDLKEALVENKSGKNK